MGEIILLTETNGFPLIDLAFKRFSFIQVSQMLFLLHEKKKKFIVKQPCFIKFAKEVSPKYTVNFLPAPENKFEMHRQKKISKRKALKTIFNGIMAKQTIIASHDPNVIKDNLLRMTKCVMSKSENNISKKECVKLTAIKIFLKELLYEITHILRNLSRKAKREQSNAKMSTVLTLLSRLSEAADGNVSSYVITIIEVLTRSKLWSQNTFNDHKNNATTKIYTLQFFHAIKEITKEIYPIYKEYGFSESNIHIHIFMQLTHLKFPGYSYFNYLREKELITLNDCKESAILPDKFKVEELLRQKFNTEFLLQHVDLEKSPAEIHSIAGLERAGIITKK